jgi:hypothetical protein
LRRPNSLDRSVEAVSGHDLEGPPAEAAGYGKFLVDVATAVAEASKEGGFLGLGGMRVSAEEKRAIDQIKSVAGMALV